MGLKFTNFIHNTIMVISYVAGITLIFGCAFGLAKYEEKKENNGKSKKKV